MNTPLRIEHDAFGPVEIPSDRYWGAQTQRALGLFDIGEERFPTVLIRAFGMQKYAAARANARCGVLAPELASAIEKAATELRDKGTYGYLAGSAVGRQAIQRAAALSEVLHGRT